MSRALTSAILLLETACSSTEQASQAPRRRPPNHRGAVEPARAFVDAVNRLDSEAAAALIDWDVWVAEDAKLHFLLNEMRQRAQRNPPTPGELSRRPIKGSEVTLGQILDSPDAPRLIAGISRERFKTAMSEDFALDRRKNDARLASWNLDRIDRSATVFMPNGQRVEMALLRRQGRWRLVPRWYP